MTLVAKDLDLDPKRFPPGAILHWVSNHKNELRDAEVAAGPAPVRGAKSAAYSIYQRRLREANALDFDDLIMSTVHLFQDFPDVRETYRRRFRHVLVDEYQDTNHAQYALIAQLCAAVEIDVDDGGPAAERPTRPARRADGRRRRGPVDLRLPGRHHPQHPGLRDRLPGRQTILLEQNYRSTQTILTAANAVIGHNEDRKPKKLWSDAGDGERIVGYVADDEHDEARFVASEIGPLVDDGARPADVAVFYRTNAQSRVFEEVFIRTGQPYRVVGGVRFYERREIRDALAYLRVLVNPDDQVSLRRILNTPKRGIGDRAVECVDALAESERLSFWEALRRAADAPGLAARSLRNIEGFVKMVEELQSMVDAGERADVVLESRADPVRLPLRSRAVHRPAGRDPPREPRRAGRGGARVQRGPAPGRPRTRPTSTPGRSSRASATSWNGCHWSPTPTRSPTTRTGRRHADDPAHGQGAGVPGRVPHRPRGRGVPALPLARRPPRAGGGAPAGLRRRDPRPGAALPLAGADAVRLGCARAQPGSRFLDELPVDLVDWRRTEAAQTSWSRPDLVGSGSRASYGGRSAPTAAGRRNFSAAAARADAAAKAKPARDIPSLEPGDRVLHDTSGWAPSCRPRVTATGRSRRSTSGARVSSGCCCAMRRWRSSRSCAQSRSVIEPPVRGRCSTTVVMLPLTQRLTA